MGRSYSSIFKGELLASTEPYGLRCLHGQFRPTNLGSSYFNEETPLVYLSWAFYHALNNRIFHWDKWMTLLSLRLILTVNLAHLS